MEWSNTRRRQHTPNNRVLPVWGWQHHAGFLGRKALKRSARVYGFALRSYHLLKMEKQMSQPAHKIGRIAATIWNNDGFYSVDVKRT